MGYHGTLVLTLDFMERFDYPGRFWNQSLLSVHNQLNSRTKFSPWPVAKYMELLFFFLQLPVFITWSLAPEYELQQWNMKVSDGNIVMVGSEADRKGHNVQLVMERTFLLSANWRVEEFQCFTIWDKCSVVKDFPFPEGKSPVPLKLSVIQMSDKC